MAYLLVQWGTIMNRWLRFATNVTAETNDLGFLDSSPNVTESKVAT